MAALAFAPLSRPLLVAMKSCFWTSCCAHRKRGVNKHAAGLCRRGTTVLSGGLVPISSSTLRSFVFSCAISPLLGLLFLNSGGSKQWATTVWLGLELCTAVKQNGLFY